MEMYGLILNSFVSECAGRPEATMKLHTRKRIFSLYNTPVLDFIQAGQGTRTNPLLAILCEDTRYARGLSIAVKSVSAQGLIFSSNRRSPEKIRKTKPCCLDCNG